MNSDLPGGLHEDVRRVLDRVAHDPTTTLRHARRARALLLADAGVPNTTVAREVGASPTTTRAWVRAMREDGLASLATRAQGSGRPAWVQGLELEEIVEAIERNEHRAQPLSARAVARRFGVSTATVSRIRADLRIASEHSPLPRHHLAEVVGVLVAPGVSAVALALDPRTSRAFARSRRGPHAPDSCPGGLVAAMAAVDVVRERGSGTAEHATQLWERTMRQVVGSWPSGADIHVIVCGSIGVLPHAVPGRATAVARHGELLLRIRRTAPAAWVHGRKTFLARALRAAGRRENFHALPALLTELDAGLTSGADTVCWVAPLNEAEFFARRSRADMLERIRQF